MTNIGAKFEFESLGDNKFIRFNIAYPVHVNCDVNKPKEEFLVLL